MRITDYISAEEFSKFCEINNAKTIFHIVKEWVFIIAAIVLCEQYWNWGIYLITVWWIAARKHGMLWLGHDGVHGRMFKSPFWNNFVTIAFLLTPNFFSFTAYREYHVSHHRNLGNEKDPENRPSIKENVEGWSPFIKYLLPRVFNNIILGFFLIRFFELWSALRNRYFYLKARVKDEKPDPELMKYIYKSRAALFEWCFYIAAGVAITYLEGWRIFLLYWMVPHFTVLSLMMLIRSWSEHEGVDNSSPLTQTRTIVGSWFDRVLFTPNSGNYHLEHHLAAGVPHYNLARMHKRLMQNEDYRQKALVSQSYLDFIMAFFKLKKAS